MVDADDAAKVAQPDPRGSADRRGFALNPCREIHSGDRRDDVDRGTVRPASRRLPFSPTRLTVHRLPAVPRRDPDGVRRGHLGAAHAGRRAPGDREDRGRAFVGPAGRVLWQCVDAAGIDPPMSTSRTRSSTSSTRCAASDGSTNDRRLPRSTPAIRGSMPSWKRCGVRWSSPSARPRRGRCSASPRHRRQPRQVVAARRPCRVRHLPPVGGAAGRRTRRGDSPSADRRPRRCTSCWRIAIEGGCRWWLSVRSPPIPGFPAR